MWSGSRRPEPLSKTKMMHIEGEPASGRARETVEDKLEKRVGGDDRADRAVRRPIAGETSACTTRGRRTRADRAPSSLDKVSELGRGVDAQYADLQPEQRWSGPSGESGR